jgi:hypothetical protein
MKQMVSSHSNVILTRQTCGQRSGMAAGSKRRALALSRFLSLRRVSIQKPASGISQLSRRENGSIFQNTDF